MDLGNKLEGTRATIDTEIESFFSSAPPLKNSFDFSEQVDKFIRRNSVASGKPTFWLNQQTIFEFLYVLFVGF